MRKTTSRLLFGAVALGVCLLVSSPVSALVIYPDADGNDPTLSDTPSDSVVGVWNNSTWGDASCVAVGPNHVITTAHQGVQTGTTVKLIVDGAEAVFNVGETTWQGEADLRVAQLWTQDGQPANLSSYVPVYTAGDEVGRNATMGAWGMVRGAEISRGFEWADVQLDAPKWGVNDIDSAGNYTFDNFTSDVLAAKFNNSEGQTDLAGRDSGGGAFVKEDEIWTVLGLNAYSQRSGESIYTPPDTMRFIRLSSYANWINSIALDYTIPPGDANWDGEVDENDFSILLDNWDPTGENPNNWEMGDFTGDGAVGNDDFAIVLANWTGSVGDLEEVIASDVMVPEPTTVAMLATGALLLAGRRRRGK